jgi:hypothetical protein
MDSYGQQTGVTVMISHILKKRWITALGLTVFLWTAASSADPAVGDQAVLFNSVDENMEPVDMADLVQDKPLVVVVGSAS